VIPAPPDHTLLACKEAPGQLETKSNCHRTVAPIESTSTSWHEAAVTEQRCCALQSRNQSGQVVDAGSSQYGCTQAASVSAVLHTRLPALTTPSSPITGDIGTSSSKHQAACS
jgi:hypothetical protein